MDNIIETRELQIERKHFQVEFRENDRGRFLRITEEAHGLAVGAERGGREPLLHLEPVHLPQAHAVAPVPGWNSCTVYRLITEPGRPDRRAGPSCRAP